MRRKGESAIERMLRMNMLLDAYGSLLTDKQREFMRLHYEEDCSFGEIANDFSVSRQAVHDSVKHAERILENLEDKLSLVDSMMQPEERRQMAEKLIDLKQRVKQQWIIYNSEWIVEELTKIVDTLVGRGENRGQIAEKSAEKAKADSVNN